jgi:hypothetical protein
MLSELYNPQRAVTHNEPLLCSSAEAKRQRDIRRSLRLRLEQRDNTKRLNKLLFSKTAKTKGI